MANICAAGGKQQGRNSATPPYGAKKGHAQKRAQVKKVTSACLVRVCGPYVHLPAAPFAVLERALVVAVQQGGVNVVREGPGLCACVPRVCVPRVCGGGGAEVSSSRIVAAPAMLMMQAATGAQPGQQGVRVSRDSAGGLPGAAGRRKFRTPTKIVSRDPPLALPTEQGTALPQPQTCAPRRHPP